jgi:hypothetical protein
MPTDRRKSSAPTVDTCCGAYCPPGEYRCPECVFHLAPCHTHRRGLARLDAVLGDLADVAGRAGRVNYGGRAT